MNILANLIGNIKLGIISKKLKIYSKYNKFILRILKKMYIDGLIRGIEFNYNYIYIFLKYDENFISLFYNIKLLSSFGYRYYLRYNNVLNDYNNNLYMLLTTSFGLFFIHEIILNNLKLGGETIIKINFY